MIAVRTAILMAACIATLRAESWDNPPGGLPRGVQHLTFTSASMKCPVGYTIYLPADYQKNREARYPVLYYLHGRGGTEDSEMGNFELFDAAIAERKIPPFIYVHAMCGRNSGYVDSADHRIMGETVFIAELIPWIDATYRTYAFKGGRAVQGFSMGGQGALLAAFKHPELFSSVIGYAAGLARGAELKSELPAVFTAMHNDDIAQFDATSAWAFARSNADKLATGIAIRQVLGDQDPHLERNHRMNALLTELHIPHEYQELPGVGHDPGRVYHDVGVEGFMFHVAHFDLAPPAKARRPGQP